MRVLRALNAEMIRLFAGSNQSSCSGFCLSAVLTLRRMDRDLRLRAPHRRAARPADPPRHHPRDERRQLPARPEPQAKTPSQRLTQATRLAFQANAPWHTPAIRRARVPRRAAPVPASVLDPRRGRLLRRPVAGFSSAVDRLARRGLSPDERYLPYGHSGSALAQQLMAIASDPRISNAIHGIVFAREQLDLALRSRSLSPDWE